MHPVETAVVTGASSGVGEATALALAERGARLVLVARRGDRLVALAARIQAAGGDAVALPGDMSDATAAGTVMGEAEAALGTVAALVCCHGVNVPARALKVLTVENWDTVVAGNLSSVFYCVRAVLPGMRQRGGGRIVAVSSVAGIRPGPLSGSAYSAAKAGLNAFSACLNLEENPNGIRSSVICPGDIDTELLDKRPNPPSPAARSSMLRATDIAELIVAVLAQPEHVVTEEVVVRPRV